MRSKLTQCYDYRQLAVPEELKKWRFPESQIDQSVLRVLTWKHRLGLI